MHLFQTKSRELKIVEYLVGSGLFSNIPDIDSSFYFLAGSCASLSWPTEPRTRTNPISAADGIQLNLCNSQKCCDSEVVDPPSELSAILHQEGNTLNNDALDKIFKPKPSLPVPLFQETFRRWKSSMDMQLRFRRLRRLRARILLQPLDEFPSFVTDFQVHLRDYGHLGFFELLLEFMRIFLSGADISLHFATSTSTWNVASRVHKSTGEPQWLATELNQQLAKLCLPSDAFGVVGITWTDLFPSEKENFALGETAVEHHSAVVCFGRFETKQSDQQAHCADISMVDGDLIWRMIKVIAHETCHLFYMSHCVFFDCLMNQSSTVAEAVSQPLYLCPVCMRKLQKVLRFPSVAEYMKNLLQFLRQLVDAGLANQQLTNTVAWLEHCLAAIES